MRAWGLGPCSCCDGVCESIWNHEAVRFFQNHLMTTERECGWAGAHGGVAQSRKPIKLISESGLCAIDFVIIESNGFGVVVVVFLIQLVLIMVFLLVFGFYSNARVGIGSVFLL